MSNAADAVIMAAIHTAFESYPKEGDADWRSPSWILPEECAHLTRAIMRALDAAGLQVVDKNRRDVQHSAGDR
jgi:hypothetical protein